MKRTVGGVLATVALSSSLIACGSGSSGSGSSGSAGKAPAIDASVFVRRVDNPYFPLAPGTTYRYRGRKDGKPSIDVVRVTHRTENILGVDATAVDDRLYLNGKLAERTTDWYAQDRKGNVWYLGEKTAELDPGGGVKSTEGSWRAGRNGARPGIYMPAQARVGQGFTQEYYKGHAEDHFKTVDLAAAVKVPYVSSRQALRTREWTPLEPGVIDAKYYVRGVGTVLEQTLKGGDERNELVSVTKG